MLDKAGAVSKFRTVLPESIADYLPLAWRTGASGAELSPVRRERAFGASSTTRRRMGSVVHGDQGR